MATLERFVIEAGFNTKPFFKGIKDLNKKLLGIGKTTKKLSSSFSSMFKVAGIAGLTAMTLNAAKLGREMGLISRYTGISTENISKMQNAFAASGGDAKEVGQTLQRITQGLARLSMGDASFASKLSAMNINVWDEYGRVKDAEKIRLEMADWIQGQLKAGRSLAEVATFMGDNFQMSQAEVEQLSVGSKELLRIEKEVAKRTGHLREEESKSLEDLQKKISELRVTITTTFSRLLSQIAPKIEEAFGWIQKIFTFIQDHKDIFAPILGGLVALKGAFMALNGILSLVGGTLNIISPLFSALHKGLSLLPALFTAISSHPLVAMAVGTVAAGSWVGKKIGNSETANKIVTKIFGGWEVGSEQEKFIREQVASGQITEERANEIRRGLGLPIIESYYDDSKYKKPFPTIFGGDVGNSVDLSQVSSTSNSGTFKIEFENDITVNASSIEEATIAKAISDVQMRNYNNMKDYFRQNLPRLADGGV